MDRMEEECGVFGYYPRSHELPSAQASYFGLYSLQHRGQEAAGITVYDPDIDGFRSHRGVGLVSHIFDEEIISGLEGRASIGHVRYSTHGSSSLKNAQPFTVRCRWGNLGVAHNGNLVNAESLVSDLEAQGSIFQSGLDTEVLCHLISRSRAESFADALTESLRTLRGAYSLTILLDGVLYAVRDPHGFRPLVIGRLGDDTVVASETCALDLLGAKLEREVEAGEILRIDGEGVHRVGHLSSSTRAACIFELVYFSRPDSTVFGQSAYLARVRMGQELAREAQGAGQVVVPVPDSGVYAALGYSEESGIPYAMGLTRNHYIGRTFISPEQKQRELKLRVKLNPIPDIFRGKDVVLVDDSIVRGTTSRKLVKMLWNCEPRSIHLKISSPPITHPCLFGIDTPSQELLIAAHSSVDEIQDYLGVTSLQYLSLDGLMRAVGAEGENHGFCRACFDGEYPVPVRLGSGPRRISEREGGTSRQEGAGRMPDPGSSRPGGSFSREGRASVKGRRSAEGRGAAVRPPEGWVS